MQNAVGTMVNEIVRIMAGDVYGIWLDGSVVMDDFRPGWSDIDFAALTNGPVSEDQAEQLVTLRQTMLEKDGVKIRYPGMISPAQVARKALADNRKGMDMSVPSFFAQFCRLYSKWMPTKLVMAQWSRMIAKYVDS